MSYSFKKYFLMLANYNAWANQKLFSVLKDLNEGAKNFFEMEILLRETGNYISKMMMAHTVTTMSLAIFKRAGGIHLLS